MTHDYSLVATVAFGFALAFPLGFIAHKVRLPPLVGYLLAGVLLVRFGPEGALNSALAGQLAEIGVMLLMFGVGLHFSPGALMAVRKIAIPGAIAQILISTVISALIAKMWGWTFGAGLVFGLSLSVASTVVVLKALEERNEIDTPNGRIAVGWLVVEDLVTVVALVGLPAVAAALGGNNEHSEMAGESGLLTSLLLTLLKVALFVALALLAGPRVMPWLLRQVARTGSRELFTLCILAVALGIAFASAKLFGVSYALGAFFAGVVLSESDLSHKAAANSLPLQDAFAVLFFVSVGMLVDPAVVTKNFLQFAVVLFLIVFVKAFVAFLIVLTLRYPIVTAFSVAAALAQIGEFSFILAGLGLSYGLLPPEGLSLILAGALFSISLNPLLFAAVDYLSRCVEIGGMLKRRFQDGHAAAFAHLRGELEKAHAAAEARLTARKAYTPEELALRFPLFAALTAEQRETVALHFETRTAAPGERVIRAGDKADVVYFISSGEVEIIVNGHKTKMSAGDYFGEIALLTGGVRSADVIALDFCKFLTLSRKDFRELLRRFPGIRGPIAAEAKLRQENNLTLRDRSLADGVLSESGQRTSGTLSADNLPRPV